MYTRVADSFRVALFCVLAVSLIIFGLTQPSVAVAQSELKNQIDAILDNAYPQDQPGAAVITVRGGQTVYEGARGLANLELDVPLKPNMVFRLGSITKQFTAAAIMMLVEDGKLKLDDEITKFLPDYPTHGHTITVEHLLNHTSGIKSYTNIPDWMQTKIKSDLTADELIDGFKYEPMEFAPGERFQYNNSGYVLLGAIIEKVSGLSYEDFIEKRIFEPLGMNNSYYGSHSRIIPNRASGYGGAGEELRNAQYLSMTQPYSAGSLLSTVGDLARWNAALFSGKVVNDDALEKMTTPCKVRTGSSNGYGFGLVASDLRGHRAVQHGGGIFGFATHGIYLPDEDVYVAVLSNHTGAVIPPNMVGNQIAALVAGDPFPVFTAVQVDPTILKRYVGVYRIDEHTTRTVTEEDGKLYTQRTDNPRLEATPSSETAFFYKTSFSHFEFVQNDKGEVTGMKMFPDGSKTAELATKTDEPIKERQVADVSPAVFDDLVGQYELRPGFVLTVTREDDRLMTQATGQSKVQVFPESELVYFLKMVDAQLTFVRDDEGKVNKVILKQGGREMSAKRIQ